MTSERADALKLADRLLDEPYADPDDDLRMLSRQLIRASEAEARMLCQCLDLLSTAFLKETGLRPSEVELVQDIRGSQNVFYFRKRQEN